MISRAMIGIAIGVVSIPAVADDTTDALTAFYDLCLEQGPDYERTTASARALGWQPLPTELLAMFAPVDQTDAVAGWVAAELPAQTMVAVTKGRYQGKPVQTCSVAVDKVDGAAFEAAFVSTMHPQQLSDDSDGVQSLRSYSLEVGAIDQLISITFGQSPGLGGILVASTIAKSQ